MIFQSSFVPSLPVNQQRNPVNTLMSVSVFTFKAFENYLHNLLMAKFYETS